MLFVLKLEIHKYSNFTGFTEKIVLPTFAIQAYPDTNLQEQTCGSKEVASK